MTLLDPAAPAREHADDQLGALLDAAVDAMIVIGERGEIARFNRSAERLFGYSAGEVAGRNVALLMPEPDRSRHDGYIRNYVGSGDPKIIGIGREVMARRKDGSTFPIHLSVGEFRRGSSRGFVGILHDISARKRQEEELRRRTEELRLVFENAPTAIATTDATGHIIGANQACARLLGRPIETLLKRRISEFIHPADRGAAVARLQHMLDHGEESSSQELRFWHHDGSVIHALLYSALVRDEQGNPVVVIEELLDRTAALTAQQEAENLRTQLAHVGRLGTLGEMVSGIAHEVNQPLTAIATYASACRRLLRSGASTPDELEAVLAKISSQAERAGQVIRGLRALTRKREQTRETLDLNALVREVAALLAPEVRLAGWTLELELAPGLPEVTGDGVQIQQVILNLLRNGMEAMLERPRGTRLAVATEAPDAGHVQIRVSDSGPGVDPAETGRLFEFFYTTKPQGMGLGLAICQSIVVAHGGTVQYRTAPTGGAEFIVRLPVGGD